MKHVARYIAHFVMRLLHRDRIKHCKLAGAMKLQTWKINEIHVQYYCQSVAVLGLVWGASEVAMVLGRGATESEHLKASSLLI